MVKKGTKRRFFLTVVILLAIGILISLTNSVFSETSEKCVDLKWKGHTLAYWLGEMDLECKNGSNDACIEAKGEYCKARLCAGYDCAD